MNTLLQLKKEIAIKVLIVMACSAPLSLLVDRPITFLTGLVFGSAIAILNFLELAKTLERSVTMPPGQAQAFVFVKYVIRFILMGVVIYVSVRGQHIHVLGTAIGLLSVKLSIIISNVIQQFKHKKATEI